MKKVELELLETNLDCQDLENNLSTWTGLALQMSQGVVHKLTSEV